MELDKPTYDQHTEPMQSHINVGFGSDVTIKELAKMIGEIVGYQGVITFDPTKPDGMSIKLMNSDRLKGMGWQATFQFRDGLYLAYKSFLTQVHR
jgi:GDP-L-fucose synthase